MRFDANVLRKRLAELEDDAAPPSRYVIAFSGGLDSSVLAHALASGNVAGSVPVLAVHIDHGLQAESADWEAHCRAFAADLGIGYRSRRVMVQLESGRGPEASAREARYTALHAELRSGDWLLSAHHREDQAETLLLNLVRGSGLAGIAGIGAVRRFGPGWLVRPLLGIDRAALKAYADEAGLGWVDDPSNRDRRFDRNFLRHEVLPRLKSRWPDIASRLQRSAAHAGEAGVLLADLAEIDLARLGSRPERLPIAGLIELSAARQRNLLRHALRRLGLSTPTALQLGRVLDEVVPARPDAQPLVSWPGAAIRRYRDHLYLLPETLAGLDAGAELKTDPVDLGDGLGVLELEPGAPRGLAESVVAGGLQLRTRVGGEEIQPVGQAHTRKLKKLLQEEGVVPWMRDRLPLVYAGDELVAVADLWVAAGASSEPGTAIRWRGRPALH